MKGSSDARKHLSHRLDHHYEGCFRCASRTLVINEIRPRMSAIIARCQRQNKACSRPKHHHNRESECLPSVHATILDLQAHQIAELILRLRHSSQMLSIRDLMGHPRASTTSRHELRILVPARGTMALHDVCRHLDHHNSHTLLDLKTKLRVPTARDLLC